MDISIDTVAWIGGAVLAAGLGALAYTLASIRVPDPALMGPRGLRRARTIESSPLFRSLDPVLRVIGSWAASLPLDGLRASLAVRLEVSGMWLGLTADELIAATALSSIIGVGLGTFGVVCLGLPPWLILAAGATFTIHPLAMLREATRVRHLSIERRLPDAVDLMTLCMGAGLDFAGALKRVVEEGLEPGTPLRDELERMLDELGLGKSRASVLHALAQRVPIRAIQDLVGAAVQAEEKGTPLSEILSIQARMLRMRRSVRAEEAAASAALKLMIPLILMFGAIMIFVMGPVGITVMEGL
jgi:tight adherence protein C